MAVGMSLYDAVERAKEIIALAEKMGIPIRLMGSCAVCVHCPNCRETFLGIRTGIAERPITDLDFMSCSKYQQQLEKLLRDCGCETRMGGVHPTHAGKEGFTYVTLGREFSRLIYSDKKTGTLVDVFLDRLAMCHTIDFKNRLEIDYPTISLADILLEKMQIVEIAEKDIKDTIVLLLEHDVGDKDEETINYRYISELLSKDWGFYYTVTTNLKNVRDKFLPMYTEYLSNENMATVKNRINRLLERIEREPKSLGWKMRAKIGTKKRWYHEVGEAEGKIWGG